MGYIRITSKCNMACEHCCYSCEPGKGEDMSMETFKKALEVLEANGDTESLALGGGEPTLHPDFWGMLGYALSYAGEGGLFIATNGTQTDTAIRLADMARKGIITAALSLDDHHDEDMVHTHVVAAFKQDLHRKYSMAYGEPRSTDYREIRNVSGIEIAVGRAAAWGIIDNQCCCDDIVVQPNGDIYLCGCLEEKIGTVDTGYIKPDDLYDWGEQCSHKRPEEEKEE